MKKLGILEIVVILSIVITAGALTYKYFTLSNENNKYVFDGSQMYKCAWVCDNILNKNIPLYAEVIGKWRYGKPFNGTVEIYKASGGTLYAIYQNTTITIGGVNAYKEDISAKKIILKPLGNAVIIYKVNHTNGKSFKDIANYIQKQINNNFKDLNITYVYINGMFGADTKEYTPTEIVNIRNKLFVDINKGLYINFLNNGVLLSGGISLKTLKNLDSIINTSNVSTSNLVVYIVINNSNIDNISNKYPVITLG